MSTRTLALLILALLPLAAPAASDAPGCSDHPAFSRLPGYHIKTCETARDQIRRFPVGALIGDTKSAAQEEVRGPYWRIRYELHEGVVRPAGGAPTRDFRDAVVRGGGKVMGEYPGQCRVMLDSAMEEVDNCVADGVTVKTEFAGRELWAFFETEKDGLEYDLRIAERSPPAGAGAPVANEMLEKIIKEGFVTLHINFDIGKASITQDSIPIIVNIVEMMKLAPDLNIQVAGHTDSDGGATSNQRLSEARAASVVGTLVASGVPAARLTSVGYGQSKPVADNRTREGRAANRRVELVKR